MATERRPSRPPTGHVPAARPTTRVPPPGMKKSPSTRFPQRPASRIVRPEGGGTTRGIPPARKKSNTPLLIGGIGGGVLLLIIIIAVAASGSKGSSGTSNPKKAAPKPLDVSEIERRGMAKCEEGCAVIQRSYSAADKAGLQKGIQLITEGNQLLDEAYQKSGNRYDTKRYNETLKMARGKVLELK